jgi:Delta-aminolevulinic acid dehydratase
MTDRFKRFRPRRVDEATRKKYRETFLRPGDFIWPVFLVEGTGIRQEILSMPGVFHYSADAFIKELSPLAAIGLKSVLLFGVPKAKGIEQAYSSDGIVQKAIPEVKKAFPELEVMTDVCLCSFTGDGHCHIGDNDATCEVLAKIAVSHAKAGADIVAPSDMMDGRVLIIRRALDAASFGKVKILSYAAKYASSFYGPFRDAADCAPRSGDRKSYQVDPANAVEAMDEIAADIEEGAAGVMIKPALGYLDVIARARARFNVPIAAYNVSGEYVMLKAGIDKGVFSGDIIDEALVSIKRAGAGRIVTYFTPCILEKLSHER